MQTGLLTSVTSAVGVVLAAIAYRLGSCLRIHWTQRNTHVLIAAAHKYWCMRHKSSYPGYVGLRLSTLVRNVSSVNLLN
ncbi:uncharacterized protein EI90DRAFT_3028922 [Cantharellus anzutake]|uniref:uncharacterized protein n=1 Tax=Cantharellus anzutake TaxID=1750568 RepID=UPI0019049570|nr:uncharacterized protein EI90DRAFT_3028922 [Cantharellus anzutake]KAF8344236.1 hypothetical protein EI90DRAFT_3028922 [Cantharellus anzutake]